MNANTESMYARCVAIGKHTSISVEEVAGGRTTRYRVMAKRPHHIIGWVRWYGPWKEWCFLPLEGTIWSADCLRDVLELLNTLDAGGTPRLKAVSNSESPVNSEKQLTDGEADKDK